MAGRFLWCCYQIGIAYVSHRNGAAHFVQDVRVKNVAYQSHVFTQVILLLLFMAIPQLSPPVL